MTTTIENFEADHEAAEPHSPAPASGHMRSAGPLMLVAVAFVGLSIAARNTFHGKPFILIFSVGLILSLVCLLRTKSNRLRKLLLATASIFLCLALAESAFLIADTYGVGPEDCEIVGYENYYSNDPDLGYYSVPSTTTRVRKVCQDKVLYDVTYTINEHGQRLTNGDRHGDSIVFFGGSFTFGEGVEDEESMPAVVSRRLRHKYNVVNMGFHGWGPHQMLRLLETERERPSVSHHVKHVIYTAISGHVTRCKGEAFWDRSGPRYDLNTAGEINYQGPFPNSPRTVLSRVVKRSWCGQYIQRQYDRSKRPTARDYKVFARIVRRAADIIDQRYQAPFTVVIWSGQTNRDEEMLRALKNEGLSVIEVADFLQSDDPGTLTIARGLDGHPTPLAYETVGPELISRLALDAH